MYQLDEKLEYLSTKREVTQKQFLRFFTKVAPLEEKTNKSIHEFSAEEIKETLLQIQPKSSRQAKVYYAIINGYRKHKNQENCLIKADGKFCSQFR